MYNGYYYGFDMTYLVLVVPALLIALIAQIQVKSARFRAMPVCAARAG